MKAFFGLGSFTAGAAPAVAEPGASAASLLRFATGGLQDLETLLAAAVVVVAALSAGAA